MPIELFDPARDPHGHSAIVFRQFCDGVNLPPDRGTRLLRRHFAAGARCAVWFAAANPWAVVGFAIVAAAPQTVIWCWTEPKSRTPKGAKQRTGVMTDVLAKLGVNIDQAVTALYRSPAAEGMQRRRATARKPPIVFADENPQPKDAA